jgi:hypothetical protein
MPFNIKDDFWNTLNTALQDGVVQDTSTVTPQPASDQGSDVPIIPNTQPNKQDTVPVKEKVVSEPSEEVRSAPEYQALQTFFPKVLEDNIFFEENHVNHIDASLNVLMYLRALGYKTAMFVLGDEHDMDSCDMEENGYSKCYNLSTQDYSIDEILSYAKNHAASHSYYPAKPINAFAHPGCKCHFYCWSPVTVDEIPDNAPHLPMWSDAESLLVAKESLFEQLQDTPVDRWTVLDKSLYDIEKLDHTYHAPKKSDSSFVIHKIAEKGPVPVKIISGFVYKFVPGILRPVPDTYVGIKLEDYGDTSKVYLVDTNYTITVKNTNIESLSLHQDDNLSVEDTRYVLVDDSLGVLLGFTKDEKAICYLPDFDSTLIVDEYTPLAYS